MPTRSEEDDMAAAGGMKCDFCSSPSITRLYDALDHVALRVSGFDLASEGAWAACDDCATLIDANDREGLLARSLDSFFDLNPQIPRNLLTRQALEQVLREIHRQFFAHRRNS
jgi:hypothetical protein